MHHRGVEPAGGAPGNRTLWLSFWAEVHYNSINPAGEPPPSPPEFLKRKLLGSVKLHRLVFGGDVMLVMDLYA